MLSDQYKVMLKEAVEVCYGIQMLRISAFYMHTSAHVIVLGRQWMIN